MQGRLCLLFVEYEKTFDSVELNAALRALEKEGIDENYAEVVKEENKGCSTDITLFTEYVRIPMEDVRQRVSLLPKLFTAYYEMMSRNLNWEGGVSVNGKRLNHLLFADDLVLIANSGREVNEMLQELSARSKEVVLVSNAGKTKWCRVSKVNLQVDDVDLEEVDSYVSSKRQA